MECSTSTNVSEKDNNINTLVVFGTSDNNRQWSDDEGYIEAVGEEELQDKKQFVQLVSRKQNVTKYKKRICIKQDLEFLLEKRRI